MKRFKFAPVAFSIVLFIVIGTQQKAFSITNEKLIKSAKQIVYEWSFLLNKDHTLLSGTEGVWRVYRSALMGDLSFDIQKTSSIVSPYLLIITGEAQWDNNLDSAHADNYSEVSGNNFGFTTKEKALSHVNEFDFGRGNKTEYKIKIIYAFQEGSWVLTKSNNDFLNFLKEKSSIDIKKGMANLLNFNIE